MLLGKVAENANISSAIHPAWRTGKTHVGTPLLFLHETFVWAILIFSYRPKVVIYNTWPDSTSPATVLSFQKDFTAHQVPLLQRLAGGPRSGAYSNEADVHEPDFQWTFFGPNYDRLSEIKRKYDPDDLFIVGAGVGSERWDESGLCRAYNLDFGLV